MRLTAFLSLALLLLPCAATAQAGTPPVTRDPISLADILPPHTLALLQRPQPQAQEEGFRLSIMKKIFDGPEMANFLKNKAASRENFIREIAKKAKLEPAFIRALLRGRLSLALLDISTHKSKVEPTLALSIQLEERPDQTRLFNAVKAIVDRPEFTRAAAEKGIPLTWVENYPGNHKVLLIAHTSPLRFTLLGRTIIVYRGPTSEGLKTILANYDNALTAKTLSSTEPYREARKGAETKAAMSFLYINTTRLCTFLNALQFPKAMRLIKVLGIDCVQAIGMAGGYYGEGQRHTLYLHAPGRRRGLLNTLRVRENAEMAAGELPKDAPAILAARVDLSRLYDEIPRLFDAVEQALGIKTPVGLSRLAGKQTLLGVPALEVLRTLGDAIILQPGPDGTVMRFDAADCKAFESVLVRMERTLGTSLSKLRLGDKYYVSYFNKSKVPLPVAPSYCIVKRRQDGTGVVFLATHPQVITSLLRHRTREHLSDAPDYQRVMKGMGSGYGVFIYLDNRDSYGRVYNTILPALNVWSALPFYSADAGLLPPGSYIAPHFFGSGLGIKNNSEGITFTSYSPLGINGMVVYLVDKLLISNPTAPLMVVAELNRIFGLFGNSSTTGKASSPTPDRPRTVEQIPGIQ